MKKILIYISIIISVFFTSLSHASAKKWAIDSLLNLEFGIEKMAFTLSKMKAQTFSNATLDEKHKKLRQINNLIIDEFYKKYESWEIDYYAAHWLAIEQKNFAYTATQLFKYLELKWALKTSRFDTKILEFYWDTRISYDKITAQFDEARQKK